MRVLFGVILGGVSTIGGAYIYDSHNAHATNALANTKRPLVNWDVVGSDWQKFSARARAEWTRLAG